MNYIYNKYQNQPCRRNKVDMLKQIPITFINEVITE